MNNPTEEAYTELQKAYDFFNHALFGNKLPPCLITLQRKARTYGYFAYFGRDEQLKRFYSNTYYGFVRTAISDLFERFYQAHQHYLLSIFSL